MVALAPKRILIVDDDPAIASALAGVLNRAGYATEVAAHGRAALTAQARDPADAALVDLFMPEMDGLETLQRLRDVAPSLPVVMISGGALAQQCPLFLIARRLGAVAALAKPFNLEELKTALATALAASPDSLTPATDA